LLDAALSALGESLDANDELIVVESGSAHPEPVWAVARAHGARLIIGQRPGVSHARNVGWREASNDLIAFIDDDIRVTPEWAGAMAAGLAAHPDAAFVSGRIDIPAGQGTLGLTVLDRDAEVSYDRSSRGAIGHSANLGMHRAMLESVAGFDELMGPGGRWPAGEDPDLLDRCLATGALGWYEPKAAAQHEHWRRARQYVVLQHKYGTGAGARMAKLARTDRERFRVVAADDLWRWGVRAIVVELAKRDPIRAAGSVFRLAGMLRGLLGGFTVAVRDGHFVDSGRRVSNSS
jgi:glycosyltransferase involved in cell wall biosynthesis